MSDIAPPADGQQARADIGDESGRIVGLDMQAALIALADTETATLPSGPTWLTLSLPVGASELHAGCYARLTSVAAGRVRARYVDPGSAFLQRIYLYCQRASA